MSRVRNARNRVAVVFAYLDMVGGCIGAPESEFQSRQLVAAEILILAHLPKPLRFLDLKTAFEDINWTPQHCFLHEIKEFLVEIVEMLHPFHQNFRRRLVVHRYAVRHGPAVVVGAF